MFTDFSSGVGIFAIECKIQVNICLGFCLAVAFFLQLTISEILAGIQQAGFLNQMHTFILDKVAFFISTHLPESKHIVLM